MKTFKLVSFELLYDDGKDQKLPLVDGIIINQENDEKTWILELFLEKQYLSIFNELMSIGKNFDVRVIITFPENEPAPFTVSISKITEFDNNISVLMKGKIKVQRSKYAEKLLGKLLNENYSKDELFHHFVKGMRERPRIE